MSELRKMQVEITAVVTAYVLLGEGETVETFQQREVDIYLHGAGAQGCFEKEDLGARDVKIVILEEPKQGAKAICGNCGSSQESPDGMCFDCHGDDWIQFEDFVNPEMEMEIVRVCENLEVSKNELLVMVYKVTI